MTEANEAARRPLKVRNRQWAQNMSAWLARHSISPNTISVFSVIFAGLTFLALLLPHFFAEVAPAAVLVICPLLAALCIQGRLLCNLFDGMVAVEGGKTTPGGELFNDVPDRISDPLIIVGVGYAIGEEPWLALAWLAALLAVMTAYVRTLATSLSAPSYFVGPMAKQHRMALLTLACVVTAMENPLWHSFYAFKLALLVMCVGCVITLYRRLGLAHRFLKEQGK